MKSTNHTLNSQGLQQFSPKRQQVRLVHFNQLKMDIGELQSNIVPLTHPHQSLLSSPQKKPYDNHNQSTGGKTTLIQEFVNENLNCQKNIGNSQKRHLEALSRILKSSREGMIKYKSNKNTEGRLSDLGQPDPWMGLQIKSGVVLQNQALDQQKKSKSLPKNSGFHLKCFNASKNIYANQAKFQTRECGGNDLQLVGNQFQSKASPEVIIGNLEQRKTSQDCTAEARELLLFLKRRYHEFPSKRDYESRLRAIKKKISERSTYNNTVGKEGSLDYSSRQQDQSLIDNSSTIEGGACRDEDTTLIEEDEESERLKQSNRHRKLISVLNASKINNLQSKSQRESNSGLGMLNKKQLGQNVSYQRAKTSKRINIGEQRNEEPLVSQSIAQSNIKRLIALDNDKEQQQQIRKNMISAVPRCNTRSGKRSGNLIQQQLINQFESDEEKLERMYRFQKEIKAKYSGISMNQNIPSKDEPYKYIIIRGNNSELIKKCLDDRNGDWQEIQCTNTLFNFKWAPFSKGIRFDYLTGHGQKKMVNHFEFHELISQKDQLFQNLLKYSDSQKRNVFNIHPITFSIDLSSQSAAVSEIEKFQLLFNIIEKSKNLSKDQRCAVINKEITNSHLFATQKSKSYMKYTICENMFDGNNLWLLKPTDFNRGRGVQVFNSLELFKKLITEYQQGVQVKYTSSQIEKVQPNKIQEDNSQKASLIAQCQQQSLMPIPPEQQLSNFTNLENVPNIVKTDAFVVQKYLERPLLIQNRKFDIRLWVLIAQDSKAYLFKEGYIRTSSFAYDASPSSVDKLFIHLTNNAVQKCNDSYGIFEEGNQLSFEQAMTFLKKEGVQCDLQSLVQGPIVEIIRDTLKSIETKINSSNRKFCMEIFGYDFIIDQSLKPWLIEVNTNPCLEESSSLLSVLLPRMIDDALKLTLDVIFPPKKSKVQSQEISNDISIKSLQPCVEQNRSINLQQLDLLNNHQQTEKCDISDSQPEAPIAFEPIISASNIPQEELTQPISNINGINKSLKQIKSSTPIYNRERYGRSVYRVPGYSDTESMWNLIYQLKAQ